VTGALDTGIALAAGALEVAVRAGPFLEITSLRHDGDELLVDAAELPPGGAVHGRAAGVTFLHPWANRLGADAYGAAGVEARLDPGDPALARDRNGLAIHGLAAPAGAWRLTAADAARAEAVLDHDGAAGSPFPFPHRVEVDLALRHGCLVVVTTLRATGPAAVPVAFGWHPYFRLPGEPRTAWRLALPARRRVALDARGLPIATGRDWDEPADERRLGRRALDDGLRGLAPGACLQLRGGGRRIRVRLCHGYPAAQVYAPPEVDVVSLEPMAAVTNALATGDELHVVAPGDSFSAAFAIDVRDYR
jgi:galactose mutarotase-like enzyme